MLKRFSAAVIQTWPTHSGSFETNSSASSMSNWERLRGRALTPGETGWHRAGATFQHLTRQLVIKPFRYGRKTHSPFFISHFPSLITPQASWFTSPSQLNMDDSLFFFLILNANESQFNGYAMVYEKIKVFFYFFYLFIYFFSSIGLFIVSPPVAFMVWTCLSRTF